MGYWSQTQGAKLITSADLAALVAMNLRNANGSSYDPPSVSSLQTWIANASATNMAYMLSAQLTATTLNVRHGLLSDSTIVNLTAFGLGITTIGNLRNAANTALGLDGNTISGDPNRNYQEALKSALDAINADSSSVAEYSPTPPSFTSPY